MSEAAPEVEDQTAQSENEPVEPVTESADSTDWKAEARKWEQRAKDNKAAASELEKQRRASMTEAERAVAEAETRGRLSATAELGSELARSRFDILAARRNPTLDEKALDGILEYVDMTRFLGEDGRPDPKIIAAAVERLVPAPQANTGIPSLDLGEKTPALAPQGMTSLIRKAAGRA